MLSMRHRAESAVFLSRRVAMKKMSGRTRSVPIRDERAWIEVTALRHVRGGVQNPLREQTIDVLSDGGSVEGH
jgi:hypothetical protein